MRSIILLLVFGVLGYLFYESSSFLGACSGIAIFLYGVMCLKNGFSNFSTFIERVLKKWANTATKSLIFGAISTMIMQSSGLVSVLAISFLSAGFITLGQGIGIIFGANVGTTIVAWVIAIAGVKFDISSITMPLLVFGVILNLQNSKTSKAFGSILCGIGFFFLGISLVKSGFNELKDIVDIAQYGQMSGILGVSLFVFIGIVLTVIMQSSNASLLVAITILAAGQMSYENALGFAIGSNIGSTVMAIIGSIGTNITGKRLAAAHLLFNSVTALVAVVFLHQMISVVRLFCDAVGIASDDYILQLTAFHTLFNIVGIALMMPFIEKMVWLLEKFIVDKEAKKYEPIYLNHSIVEYPDTAIEALRNEMEHLYDNCFLVLTYALGFTRKEIHSNTPFREIIAKKKLYRRDVDFDNFYQKNIKYLFDKMFDFATIAQTYIHEKDQMSEIAHIKKAARRAVESIHQLKMLYRNLKEATQTSNEALAEIYNEIRINLAETLRSIENLETISDEKVQLILASIRKGSALLDQADDNAISKVEKLILDNKISANNASSILNDIDTANKVSKDLLVMTQHLYAAYHDEES
ncbi:Na/Pi symporter [Helicobacter sp.]|uniref:Na/Pi cotransporter family protein n=1 Tax=Helicobacter sp. TaxID=218 RepID=UPI0019AE7245|nr:Na/Pi symporter [Helicobacter sp.]MBD5164440.1 Na/Pi cotransporter family protein [Helicobacter sp.]